MEQTISPLGVADDTAAKSPEATYPDFDSRLLATRFTAESVLIFVSVSLNLVGLAMVYITHKEKKSVYHILYINISVSNITACPLTWFWGNLPFFFPDWFLGNRETTAPHFALATLIRRYKLVMSLSVGIQMTISMLGLGVCQYFAICRPLQSIYLLQKRRAYGVIIFAWVTLVVCLLAPFSLILVQASSDVIDDVINAGVRIASNTYAGVITTIYVIMIFLALMIASSLIKYARRTHSLAREKSISCDINQMREDQKACIATAALLASRTIITLPLTIYFLIEMNCTQTTESTAIFMLNILPCAKCIFDPFIYGSLMRDVKKTWQRRIGGCCKKETDATESGTRVSVLTLDRI